MQSAGHAPSFMGSVMDRNEGTNPNTPTSTGEDSTKTSWLAFTEATGFAGQTDEELGETNWCVYMLNRGCSGIDSEWSTVMFHTTGCFTEHWRSQ